MPPVPVEEETMEAAAVAALGIALSPIPLLAVAAFLGGPRATGTATAFVSGEALAVAAVAGLVVAFTSSTLDEAAFERASGITELVVAAVLGALLLSYLVSDRDRPVSTRVLGAVDRAGPGVAFVSGIAAVVANPKNLALAVAGAGAIVELRLSGALDAVGVLAFTLLATSVLLAVLVVFALVPERAMTLLAGVRGFVERNERAVVTVSLAVLALYFLARGLLDLPG
jgi:hypothetical protein